MTPRPIAQILESNITWFVARFLITFMFWFQGLDFLIHFQVMAPLINTLGTQPVWLGPALTIAVMLAGSAMILLDRYLWLGAGLLAGFTALTIPLVHHFWDMEGAAAMQNRLESEEHLAVIGAMMAISIISHMRKGGRSA
jgi:transmembrane protein